jgi:colanic acid biosynthesis glycosyl transferase WcaI
MKLLILGLNYAPEPTGIAVYTSGMAEFLSAAGHEVEVIAGQPYYPGWRIMPGHGAWTYSRRRENGVDVMRVPHYIPRHPTGLRRVAHHASFAAAAWPPLLTRALTTRPDVIVAIAPSLAAAPMADLAARLCGAKSWLHIQDFEVEAASAMGHIDGKGGLAALAIGFERAMLTRFDRVSSISPAMCQKLAAKGVPPSRIVALRNWADPAVRPLATPSIYRDEWRIETPHVALYSGTLADKQGLDIILEAARLLRHRTDLTFIICGDGANRDALTARAAALPNIRLLPLAPRERLGDLLGLATIHLLPQRADAADLVLPSKLANMMASGRPVIATAAPGTGLAREVEDCGIATPPGNATPFAAAITALIDDPARRAALAASACRRAAERWDRDHILTRLETDLLALAAMSPRPAEQPA